MIAAFEMRPWRNNAIILQKNVTSRDGNAFVML